MWTENIPLDKNWTYLWHDKVLCSCGAIKNVSSQCPVCNSRNDSGATVIRGKDHLKESVIMYTYQGAEGRYEDYVYLRMIEHEWKRSVPSNEIDSTFLDGVSEKASIVLIFWSYFETRIERLLRLGLKGNKQNIIEDVLDKYSSISSRLEKLYKVVFNSTYAADLKSIGKGDIWEHICKIRNSRNEFIHGNPKAINDELVYSIIEKLKEEHDSWINVYNKRISIIRTEAK